MSTDSVNQEGNNLPPMLKLQSLQWKYRCWRTFFLYTPSTCGFKVSLSSVEVPRYLFWLTASAVKTAGFFLKSPNSSRLLKLFDVKHRRKKKIQVPSNFSLRSIDFNYFNYFLIHLFTTSSTHLCFSKTGIIMDTTFGPNHYHQLLTSPAWNNIFILFFLLPPV